MCGICGRLNFREEDPVEYEAIRSMCRAMLHRGPDDEGLFVDRNFGCGIRRLKIIDLETGNQPIYNEDRTVCVVFNGEIYNYLDLRKDLETKGHRFYTKSDTEVIVHLYEEKGEEFISELRGMFAIAIWDKHKRRLLLARDRLGEKPLYYYTDGTKLVFASELKAISRDKGIELQIDTQALEDYFTYQFILPPRAIYVGVKKLPAAHLLICENGKIKVSRYWQVHSIEQSFKSKQDCIETLYEMIDESVKMRMVSDVPLGAYLSGGIDSSIIVALMSRHSSDPVKTFTVGFRNSSFDERHYAQLVADAFKTEHHELEIDYDIPGLLPKIVDHFGEPFADSSAIPVYYISKYAREKVTVVLSGDGADEIFGGYRRYLAQLWLPYLNKVPTFVRKGILEPLLNVLPEKDVYYGKSMTKKAKRLLDYSLRSHERGLLSMEPIFSKREREDLFSPSLNEELTKAKRDEYWYDTSVIKVTDPLIRAMLIDLVTFLPEDILTKVDRMSMAVSLETRAPYLDHKLIEYAFSIPATLKIHGGQGKRILKMAFSKLLPSQILKRPKQGFEIPLSLWLKGELKEFTLDLLKDDRRVTSVFFRKEKIQKLLDEHYSGRKDHSKKIWTLINFLLWHKSYISNAV